MLSAIERTPRELFVDEPFEEQRLRQHRAADRLRPDHQPALHRRRYDPGAGRAAERIAVLEIGTGSGYQAAVLAQLCRRVYTVERHKPLMREAERRASRARLHNIVTRHGDGFQGWPEQAPFDRILLTAAIPEVPQNLIDQLKPGGIMVAPVGKPVSVESFSQDLVKIIRTEEGTGVRIARPRGVRAHASGPATGEFGWFR